MEERRMTDIYVQLYSTYFMDCMIIKNITIILSVLSEIYSCKILKIRTQLFSFLLLHVFEYPKRFFIFLYFLPFSRHCPHLPVYQCNVSCLIVLWTFLLNFSLSDLCMLFVSF